MLPADTRDHEADWDFIEVRERELYNKFLGRIAWAVKYNLWEYPPVTKMSNKAYRKQLQDYCGGYRHVKLGRHSHNKDAMLERMTIVAKTITDEDLRAELLDTIAIMRELYKSIQPSKRSIRIRRENDEARKHRDPKFDGYSFNELLSALALSYSQ